MSPKDCSSYHFNWRHICGSSLTQHSFLAKGLAYSLQVQPHDTVKLSLSLPSKLIQVALACLMSPRYISTISLQYLWPFRTINCFDCTNHCGTNTHSGSKIYRWPSLSEWITSSSPNFFSRIVLHNPVNWSQPILEDSWGPCDQRQ